jgi:hypothetical protein
MTLIAMVESRKGPRKGRGFSEEEVKKAGLTVAIARKLKVIVDPRRKSVYDSNVEKLKRLELPEKKPKAKKVRGAKTKKAAKPKTPKPEKKVTKKPVEKAKVKPKKPAKKPVKKRAAPEPKVMKSKKK